MLCFHIQKHMDMKDEKVFVPVDFKASFAHLRGMVLLFVPVLTTYLYSSMDKVMLGKLSTMTELGFYENATKALIAKNLATALSTVLVPRMSNLIGKNNNRKFDELMQKSLDAVLLLTVAFGFGTAAIAYIIFEGPAEDRNMNTLVDMISGMEVKEDDEDFNTKMLLLHFHAP